MPEVKRVGPVCVVQLRCAGCAFEASEYYRVQGDTGCHVRCEHPSLSSPRRVGDTTWATPSWCPALSWNRVDAIAAEESGEGEE